MNKPSKQEQQRRSSKELVTKNTNLQSPASTDAKGTIFRGAIEVFKICQDWQRQILTGVGLIAFAVILSAAVAIGVGNGVGARFARTLAWALVSATMLWMAWVIWRRNSKARWLSLAIIVEWVGVGMLYMPSYPLPIANGTCIPALQVGKSFELAGLFFGLTATIWLAAGAWLIKKERDELNKSSSTGKKLKIIAGLIASAHQQVSLGLLTAILGVVVTIASPAWEIYSKVNEIEEPKELPCRSQVSKTAPSRPPEAKQSPQENG